MNCRHCDHDLNVSLIDLGIMPPSNSYLSKKNLNNEEKSFPLKVMVCDNCWLVQTQDFVNFFEIFSDDYAYFSSFSSSWLEHSRKYVDQVVKKFQLTKKNCVVEVAANDGYLLQFMMKKNIPCYGIEPTKSTALAAKKKGIEIIQEFFTEKLAINLFKLGKSADLIICNNVLAHVPSINDFVKGLKKLLKPGGLITIEFPHLPNLLKYNQFDTIYHEHYSYLSLISVKNIFEKFELQIFKVEKIATHGGSLRLYIQHSKKKKYTIDSSVNKILRDEIRIGLSSVDYYNNLQSKADKIKNDLLNCLIKIKHDNKVVAAYGAAAKGNTLLNYTSINTDLIKFVVDKNPSKQGKYMPGSKIPIVDEYYLKDNMPNYILILPWNLKDEIILQLDYFKKEGGIFITAIPSLIFF